MAEKKLNRRNFIKQTTALTAATVAFPHIIPASARGADGNVAPSNRTVLGCIGVGSQGTGNMRNFLRFKEVQVVAVCDVDRKHRRAAQNIVNQSYDNTDCDDHDDFRDLLARNDLDAVSIAVPDHWHAIPAIAAANRGLDIYAEKPLALTISQGRAMVDAVNRNQTVWQTGSWQRSQPHFRKACELVRNGRVGEVHTVKIGLPTGSGCEIVSEQPIPDGFDYDFWLGPAPEAPYHEKRCHWNFRWILDYSGGQLTDWAAHHCDIANWAMGTEYTGPVEVEGKGEFPGDGLWDAANNYMVKCKFSAGASPVAPEGFEMHISNSFPMGARFEGTDGWLHVARSGLTTGPESIKNSTFGTDDIRLYKSRNHLRNFLDCRQTRDKTITPIEVAHRAITIAHLGNIAMKLERKIKWDPRNERFVNDPDAGRMLARAMRGSWHI